MLRREARAAEAKGKPAPAAAAALRPVLRPARRTSTCEAWGKTPAGSLRTWPGAFQARRPVAARGMLSRNGLGSRGGMACLHLTRKSVGNKGSARADAESASPTSSALLSAGLARELSVPPVFPEAEFFASVLRVSSPGLTLWCEGKGEPRQGNQAARSCPSLQTAEATTCIPFRSPLLGIRTHYDAMDNILIQVTGEKRVLLFHPADIGCLYMEGSSSRVVDVDMKESAADTARRFPRFAAARRRALEVRLRPGDVLFIPALWPHHVRAEGFSVSVNVFWRHFPADLSPKKDLYGNRHALGGGTGPLTTPVDDVLCHCALRRGVPLSRLAE